jgi:hypothetical protein
MSWGVRHLRVPHLCFETCDIMNAKNTHLLLFSAAFLLLGFLLGRVTAPGGHGRGCGHTHGHRAQGECHGLEAGDAQVEIALLTDADFEGDTAIALPGGGTVHVVRNGEEYDVEVEVDAKVREGARRDQTELRVEKRVVVIQEED